MKRTYIITLLFSLCSLFMYAQDSRFDKFADMEEVTSVYISKAMLSLMPDMQTEGVNIGSIASKLDNIRILSCDKPAIIDKMKKEFAFINSKQWDLVGVGLSGIWLETTGWYVPGRSSRNYV